MEKIRWAPKVSPGKVWQVYQNDARGAVDEALVDDVGLSLFLRCRSILMTTMWQVQCPRCETVFTLAPHSQDSAPTTCPTPGCGWQVTSQVYHESWRHHDLLGAGAQEAFQGFLDRYPRTRTVRERMVEIDQLLHAFHWDLKLNLPNRSAANNLIAGSHKDVVALLDKLTYGDQPEAKARWRDTVETMWKRRRGQLPH